ncbi:MAG TPA: sugar phosphate nucleotidyltransferase [Candidatus Acidoferrales bacterium]|nr:sugar phosphate nucleotidyltransferase [Candidatus Acidoferrales bacterium]
MEHHHTREHVWGIVLAAGSGTRVLPFLTQLCGGRGIKQFCAVTGRRSMLQHTLARAEKLIPRERIIVIVSSKDRAEVAQQLPDWPEHNVIYQPANRETAPGILLPLAHISRRDAAATVAVFPSDHFVLNEEKFLSYVLRAIAEADEHRDALILLGMSPDGPEEGYGWIEPDGEQSSGGTFGVRRFWEKPSRPRAEELFTKRALWNTFVFAAKADTIWNMVLQAAPDLYHAFSSVCLMLQSHHARPYIEHVYRNLRSVNFSSEICRPLANRLRVLPVPDVGWSDWGSAERICASLKTIGKLQECVDRLKRRSADPRLIELIATHLAAPRGKKSSSIDPPTARPFRGATV